MGEVGGNTLGLYGGVFSHTGTRILAHGYQGAFHLWKQPLKVVCVCVLLVCHVVYSMCNPHTTLVITLLYTNRVQKSGITRCP